MSFIFQPSLIPGLQMVVPPYAEPVSLAEMKLHLKQDDLTEDDTLIQSQITGARDFVETETGKNVPRNRVMLATTFEKYLDVFPPVDYIRLPRVPAVAINSITYVDTSGNLQTLDPSIYVLDVSMGRIYLAYAQVWPPTQFQRKCITIQFVAGSTATVKADTSASTITVQGRAFKAGDRVRFMCSGALGVLIGGLSALTDYFVLTTGSVFQVSTSLNGAAVTLTDTGTDMQFIGTDLTGFETLRNAVKLMVGHLYNDREGVITGPRAVAVEVPMGIQALIASQQA